MSASGEPTELPATAYAILGMLCFERELTGYDAKKWADASLRHFYWAPATSHVYRELARLEDRGLVESRGAEADEPRTKRVYRITAAGRAAVAAWAATPTDEAMVVKHPAALRVWLGHLVGAGDVRTIVERHIAQVRTRLGEIDESLAVAETLPGMDYPRAVLRWSRGVHQADLDGAIAFLAELVAQTAVQPPSTGRVTPVT
ncbi:MAG: PadR family transcriptional regulator [Acidimicrobiia bacterium]